MRLVAGLPYRIVPSAAYRATASQLNSRRNAASVCTWRVSHNSSARFSSRVTRTASLSWSSTSRTRRGAVMRLLGGVVQQQPVEADVGNGAGERLEVHRLDDVTVGAQAVRPRDVRLL